MAQLFSKKDIAIHQGIMTFHNPVLNNKNNANTKASWVTELDKNLGLSRFSSLNAGLGLGNYKNLDNRFSPYESSNFFRLKLGLLLHLPQSYSPHDLSPNFFNPFIKVAYNFDFADQHFRNLGGNKISSSLRLGVGCVVRLNHYVGLMYEFSHNQRIAMDYRTFFQHTFGMIINMEEPARRY
jgi:hypothetical protein